MPVLFVEFCRALTSVAQVPSRRLSGPKGVRQLGYRCVYFVKYSQFTDSVLLYIRFTLRRRDRRRIARRAREGALGYDFGAPFLTICKRLTVGAAIGRPRSTLPSHSFSILYFQFSILHTPNSNKQQKRAVSRPLFFIPKHQHAPFSEQNLTSLPSRIIFVVRTAHILPHIEQV